MAESKNCKKSTMHYVVLAVIIAAFAFVAGTAAKSADLASRDDDFERSRVDREADNRVIACRLELLPDAEVMPKKPKPAKWMLLEWRPIQGVDAERWHACSKSTAT